MKKTKNKEGKNRKRKKKKSMDYLVSGILTAVIVGLGLPIIGGFLLYNVFSKGLVAALRTSFSGSGPELVTSAMNSIGGLFVWMLILTALSIMNLIFTSYLISYYRTVE
jgi:hypothetical protein